MNHDELQAQLLPDGWHLGPGPAVPHVVVRAPPAAHGFVVQPMSWERVVAEEQPLEVTLPVVREAGLVALRYPSLQDHLLLESVDRAPILLPPHPAARALAADQVLVDLGALGDGRLILASASVRGLLVTGAGYHSLTRQSACPELETWLASCDDAWVVEDVEALLQESPATEWARVCAAARLERSGLDTVAHDPTAPSRARLWAASLPRADLERFDRELGVRASLLLDELRDTHDSALSDGPGWRARLEVVLRTRDDLDAVASLLLPDVRTPPTTEALRWLDEEGEDVVTVVPEWDAAAEWMWRAAVSAPGAWWTRPLEWEAIEAIEDEA